MLGTLDSRTLILQKKGARAEAQRILISQCPQDPKAPDWQNGTFDTVVNNLFSLNPTMQGFGTTSISLVQHPRGLKTGTIGTLLESK
jgi:hypothetical protein